MCKPTDRQKIIRSYASTMQYTACIITIHFMLAGDIPYNKRIKYVEILAYTQNNDVSLLAPCARWQNAAPLGLVVRQMLVYALHWRAATP